MKQTKQSSKYVEATNRNQAVVQLTQAGLGLLGVLTMTPAEGCPSVDLFAFKVTDEFHLPKHARLQCKHVANLDSGGQVIVSTLHFDFLIVFVNNVARKQHLGRESEDTKLFVIPIEKILARDKFYRPTPDGKYAVDFNQFCSCSSSTRLGESSPWSPILTFLE